MRTWQAEKGENFKVQIHLKPDKQSIEPILEVQGLEKYVTLSPAEGLVQAVIAQTSYRHQQFQPIDGQYSRNHFMKGASLSQKKKL